MLSRQYTEFKDYGSYVVSKTNEVPRSLYCQQNWLFSQREQNVIQEHSYLQHPAPFLLSLRNLYSIFAEPENR